MANGLFLKNLEEEAIIVIVDDMPDNLKVAMQYLQNLENCEIICFKEPLKGLNFVKNNKVDLVILDVGMPDLNGYDFCKALKTDPKLKEIPVIFQTAATQTEDILKGFAAGGIDYITKPLIKEVFIARVVTYLELYLKTKYIYKLANYDGLTNILNRRSVNEYIESIIKEAQINEKLCASLIMMDIDFFKLYNDTYGHLGGDNALKEVSKIIDIVCSKNGVICGRYGGEEFVVVLKDKKIEFAIAIAKLISEKLKTRNLEHKASKVLENNQAIYRVSLSMGITCLNMKNAKMEDLFKLADDNLYKAKEQGRNRFIS